MLDELEAVWRGRIDRIDVLLDSTRAGDTPPEED
jgi:hypothetical protein